MHVPKHEYKLNLKIPRSFPGWCGSCTKRFKSNRRGGCYVLRERIGAEKECFAWSDDPNWAEKVSLATLEYKTTQEKKHRGRADTHT